MPRPALGPRLSRERDGYTGEWIWVVRWTEAGRRRKHRLAARPPADPQAEFSAWLLQRGAEAEIAAARSPRRNRPPTAVTLAEVLDYYAQAAGEQVTALQTLAYSLAPLRYFLGGYTVHDLDDRLCEEYRQWRQQHRVAVIDGEAGVRTVRAYTVGELIDVPMRNGRRYRRMVQPVSDSTITRELAGVLRPALKSAARNRLFDGVPPEVLVPGGDIARERFLTRSEAAALLWQARRDPRSKRHLQRFIILGLYTGARPQALLDLTWPQIDFIAGTINLNPPGRVQTAKARPKIAVQNRLLQHLRRWQRGAGQGGKGQGGAGLGDSIAATIIHDRAGNPVGSIRRSFGTAATAAGLPDEIVPYSLRHTFASWLAMAGVTMRELADLLGQSETQITQRYAHLSPSHMRGVIDRIQRPGARKIGALLANSG